MSVKDTGPLDYRTPIVDSKGCPSPEFQRRWNTQRGNNGLIGSVTTGSGPPTGTPKAGVQYVDVSTTPFTVYVGLSDAWHQAGVVVFTDLKDAPHNYAGKGLALVRVKSTMDGVEFATQSGMLDTLGSPAAGQLLQRGASTWGLVTISAVLDGIGSTRGQLLYRGATGWAVLAPGSAGQVLSTGGPGADPTWIAAGGGATPVLVQKSTTGVRLGDGGVNTGTLTFSTGATAGNLIVLAYCGFSGSTRTVPAGFFSIGFQTPATNQGVQVFAKVATGGETSFPVAVSADHGQMMAYEISGVKNFELFAVGLTSGATTWSAGFLTAISNAFTISMFEYDLFNATVGVTAPGGAVTDYAPNSGVSSSSNNHQGVFFRLPANYIGTVSGTCGGSTVGALFATLQFGG